MTTIATDLGRGELPVGPSECIVHQLGDLQPNVRANDWRSPLVFRVSATPDYADGSRDVEVKYRWNGASVAKTVRLVWEGLGADFALCANTYQAPVLTEFAALGLACGLLDALPKLKITEVTRRGERADYWLGKELLLEVSGSQTGNLEDLRDEKAKQLLDNPFGKPGFVCVVTFDSCDSYLWFYEVAP